MPRRARHMFLAGIWVLESAEHRVWSQALAEEPCESIHLVQPRPVQGQLELCCANGREFYFSCASVSPLQDCSPLFAVTG